MSTLLRSQASEDEPQSSPVQKTTLEQPSQPDTEMQKQISAMDEAPQSAAVAQNAQTVPFAVFGQTQEAINGAYPSSDILSLSDPSEKKVQGCLAMSGYIINSTAQVGEP